MLIASAAGEAPATLDQFPDKPFAISHGAVSDRLPTQQSSLERSVAGRAAIKAGVLGSVVGMVVPVVGLLLAGALAVFFYRRDKGLTPTTRVGSRVGAAAGVVSFAINYLVVIIQIFATHGQQQYIDKVLKMEQSFGFDPSDPAIQASVHFVFTPVGIVLTFLFSMLLAALPAALAGAMAVLFSRPSSRP